MGENSIHYSLHSLGSARGRCTSCTRDPVLAQNQPLWNALGFVHTGTLVSCAHDAPRLLGAGDEESAWWRPPPLNFADHGLYLGTVMGIG